MSYRGYNCPPDFNDTFQRQFEPRPSGFQPGRWQETPGETNRGYSHHQPHHYEEATGSSGAQSAWGSHGTNEYYDETEEYYGDHGQQWHQGGGYKRRKRRRFFHKKKKRYAFRCESCDKGFEEVESFDEHMSQHVECPHPECTFLGSDKLVTMHWKFTHAEESKVFKLIASDDIEKWREERRKKYPRRANTEQKKADTKEETESKVPTPSTEPCDANESQPSEKSTETSERST